MSNIFDEILQQNSEEEARKPRLGVQPTTESSSNIFDQIVNQAATEDVSLKREYDVLGGVKDVGKMLYDVPVQTKGAIGGLFEDADPDERQTWTDEWSKEATDRTEQRHAEMSPEDRGKVVLPLPKALSDTGGVTRGDITDTSQSTGFSAASMAATAAGEVIGAATGSLIPIPGASTVVSKMTGMAASGTAAYRMDKSMITRQLLKSTESAMGRKLTSPERKELLERTKDARSDHALWEAGPEAIGNAMGMVGLKNIFKGASKNIIPKVAKGVAVGLGGELATETATQIGQDQAEHKMGLAKGEQKSFTNPDSYYEAFKEVLPAVLTLSAVTGGASYVAGKTAKIGSKNTTTSQQGDAIRQMDPVQLSQHIGVDKYNTAKEQILSENPNIEEAALNNSVREHIASGADTFAEMVSAESYENRQRNINALIVKKKNLTAQDLKTVQTDQEVQQMYGIKQADIDWVVDERSIDEQIIRDFTNAPEMIMKGAKAASAQRMVERFRERITKEQKAVERETEQQFNQYDPALPQGDNLPSQVANDKFEAMRGEDELINSIIDDTISFQRGQDQKKQDRAPKQLPMGERGFELVSNEDSEVRRGDDLLNVWTDDAIFNSQVEGQKKQSREPKQLTLDRGFELVDSKVSANRLADQKRQEIAGAKEAGHITEQEADNFTQKVIAERKAWAKKNVQDGFDKRFSQIEEDTTGNDTVETEITAEAKKEAETIIRADPRYQLMAKIKRDGGISLEQAKQMFSPETIKGLNQKYPGLLQHDSSARFGSRSVNPDEAAQENGYDSADDMILDIANAPTIKAMTAKLAQQKQAEWAKYDELSQEDIANEPWNEDATQSTENVQLNNEKTGQDLQEKGIQNSNKTPQPKGGFENENKSAAPEGGDLESPVATQVKGGEVETAKQEDTRIEEDHGYKPDRDNEGQKIVYRGEREGDSFGGFGVSRKFGINWSDQKDIAEGFNKNGKLRKAVIPKSANRLDLNTEQGLKEAASVLGNNTFPIEFKNDEGSGHEDILNDEKMQRFKDAGYDIISFRNIEGNVEFVLNDKALKEIQNPPDKESRTADTTESEQPPTVESKVDVDNKGDKINWQTPTREEVSIEWETETMDSLFFSGYPKKEQTAKYKKHFLENIGSFSSQEQIDEKDVASQLYKTESIEQLEKNIAHMNKDVRKILRSIESGKPSMPLFIKGDGGLKIVGGRTRSSLAFMKEGEVTGLVIDEQKMREAFYPLRREEFLDGGYGFFAFESAEVHKGVIDYLEGRRPSLPKFEKINDFPKLEAKKLIEDLKKHLGIPTSAEAGTNATATAKARNDSEGGGDVKTSILNNETGRAYILEDLAASIYKAGMSLNQFTKKMKAKLGSAYEQVKGKVIDLYIQFNDHLDTFTSGAEVGAVGKGDKKNLSALHNLSEENLLYADKVGGLAVPSIAIVKKDGGMNGFGGITLIGTKGLADPQKVPAFDADAYTPRFPKPVYRKATMKRAEKVFAEFREYNKKFGNGSTGLANSLWDYAVNTPNPEKIIQDMLNSSKSKAWFLGEVKGQELKPVMRKVDLMQGWASEKAEIKKFFKEQAKLHKASQVAVVKLRKDNAEKYGNRHPNNWPEEARDNYFSEMRKAEIASDSFDLRNQPEQLKRLSDLAAEAFNSKYDPSHRFFDKLKANYFNEDGLLNFQTYDQIERDQRDVGKKELNSSASNRRADRALKGMEAEFQSWAQEKVLSMFGDPKIKVDGKMVDYDIYNIVDYMTSERTKASEKSMTFSAGKARAFASTEFYDLEHMRESAKDGIDTREKVDAGKDKANNLLEKYRDGVIKHYSHTDWRGEIDTWQGLDDSMEAMARFARDGGGVKTLTKHLRSKGFHGVPASVLEIGVEAKNAMLNTPVPYFEAKPQRAVNLNEFKGAIIPSNTSQEAIDVLEKNDIQYSKVSKKANAETRRKALVRLRNRLSKEGSDVLFKKTTPTQKPHPDIKVERDDTKTTAKVDIARLNKAVNNGRTGSDRIRFTPVVVHEAVSARANTIAGLFGKRVVFFRGDNRRLDPGGVTLRSVEDIVYVNVASGYHDFSIVGHELLHHLRRDQPAVYDEFLTAVQDIIKVSEVAKYQKQLQGLNEGSGRKISLDLAQEEMIADFIGDQFTNDQFWTDLAQKEPTLFGKISKAIQAFFRKVIAKFKQIPGFESDKFFTDITAARKAANEAIAEYGRRQNKDKLFPEVTSEVTGSPAFKKWFGNSKVKSPTGRPVPVFHGSPNIFYTFNGGKAKTSTSSPMAKLGHFFAMDRVEAMGYSRGTGNVGEYFLKLENPHVTTAVKMANVLRSEKKVEAMKESLQDKGHDGIFLKDEGYFIVFDSKQIKSSENNTGGFDSSNGDVRYQPGYHGTPHRGIDQFSTDNIGTGEGAQAYGWGLYFASKKDVAEYYRQKLSDIGLKHPDGTVSPSSHMYSGSPEAIALNALSEGGSIYAMTGRIKDRIENRKEVVASIGKDSLAATDMLEEIANSEKAIDLLLGGVKLSGGQLYKVEIPEDNELLSWENEISHEDAQTVLDEAEYQEWDDNLIEDLKDAFGMTDMYRDQPEAGSTVYHLISSILGGAEKASLFLNEAGIKGIKFIDGTSRGTTKDSHNYVIFDGADTEITDTFYSPSFNQRNQPDPQKLSTLSPELEQLGNEILARMEAVRVNRVDIHAKQVELTKYIKSSLPKAAQWRVLSQVKNISKPATQAGREKALDRAIQAVEKAKKKNHKIVKDILTEKEVIARRRQSIREIRDYLGLTDTDLRKVSRKDIRLMSDTEFAKFKVDIYEKALEYGDHKQAKAELMRLVDVLRLNKVHNLRKALKLPTIDKMTKEQINEFTSILSEYQPDDTFMGQRALETVDRVDYLKGIRTWREAKDKLAEKTGVSVGDLSKIEVSGLDNFKWDSSLVEQNPFYELLVSNVTAKMMGANLNYMDIEKEANRLSKLSEKSRKRSTIDKLIPQDKQIFEYIESDPGNRKIIADEMTPGQIEFAQYIQKYFGEALQYLVENKMLEKGRENYFTHMRRTFLETWRDDGMFNAFKSIFKNFEDDKAVFNILDDDTSNILPMEKFFQYSLQRTGQLTPTKNVSRAFLTYAKTFEKKKMLDALIPEMEIYSQALTPESYTEGGLEVDRSLKKFVHRYINNKKGRRISFDGTVRQGGKVDLGIAALRTFTTMRDLALNVPVGVASFVGENVTNFTMLGSKNYSKGIARQNTAKGRKFLEKYRGFTGRSAWEEFTDPGKEITERMQTGLFGLFHQASVTSNKLFLLGSITGTEYNTGELSEDRLAELQLEMGRFRVVPGTGSIVGSSSTGKAMIQYKSWAVPIMRTTVDDIKKLSSDLKNKHFAEALSSKEAKELYRILGISSTALIVGMLAGDDDEDNFLAKVRAKAYRESTSLMQGVDPKLWLSTPRILTFLAKLGVNLNNIVTLEKYETKPGLKGVEGLKKQLTPGFIKTVYNLDDANKNYLSLRKKIRDSGNKGRVYQAVKSQDKKRSALRKKLRRLQEEGADRSAIRNARKEIQKSNLKFIEKYSKAV